jgi:hypothetical protein
MRRRPLGNSVPVAINRYINSAYDNVLLVAENIESVNKAAENIEYLQRYLGVYESGSPSERPDGTPLETGDFYYSDKATYYYNADDDTWTEFNPEELLNASVAAVNAAVEAEESKDIAVDAAEKAFSLIGGTDIGNYEEDPTFNNITDYVVFGRGTSEIALFKVEENVDLPYTVDSTTNPHPTDDDNLRAYTSTATMYTYEETTYLTDGQVVVDATSELKNYVVYLWDSASGERERLDVVYDYTTNNSNQIVLTDTYPVGSIVTIVFEDIGQNSDTYLKKQEAEQKYGDHTKQANRGSENSHPASAISTTSGESVQTMVEAIKGNNELSNSNFLTPSPDDITHPSSVATAYSAGTQIFSGVYAGEDGCTITYINGQVTCTVGSYEYRVPNTDGLDYIPTFSASIASYNGLPKQIGVSYALVSGEYVISVTPEAGSVFTVKFEQGSVATGHEVDSKTTSEWRAAGDIRGFGGFPNLDCTDAITQAASATGVVLFPPNTKDTPYLIRDVATARATQFKSISGKCYLKMITPTAPSIVNASMVTISDSDSSWDWNIKIDGNSQSRSAVFLSDGANDCEVHVDAVNINADLVSYDNNAFPAALNVGAVNNLTYSARGENFQNTGHTNESVPRVVTLRGGATNYSCSLIKSNSVDGSTILSDTSYGVIDTLDVENAGDNGLYIGGGDVYIGNLIYKGSQEALVPLGGASVKVGTMSVSGLGSYAINLQDHKCVDIGTLIVDMEDNGDSISGLVRTRNGNISGGTVKIGSILGRFSGSRLLAFDTGTIETLTINNLDVEFVYDESKVTAPALWANFDSCKEVHIGRMNVKVTTPTLSSLLILELKGLGNLTKASYLENLTVDFYDANGVRDVLGLFRGDLAVENMRGRAGNSWRTSIGPFVKEVSDDWIDGIASGGLPTGGYWYRGTDLPIGTQTSPPFRARCTVSGSPGTWVAY